LFSQTPLAHDVATGNQQSIITINLVEADRIPDQFSEMTLCCTLDGCLTAWSILLSQCWNVTYIDTCFASTQTNCNDM